MIDTHKKTLHNLIVKAINYLDKNPWDSKNNSRTGDLIYNGKLYPTKPLLWNADEQIRDEGLNVTIPSLTGGEETFKYLEKLGFEIRRKNKVQLLIESYKKHIQETHLEDEKYKWELLSIYNGRPDLDAQDFAAEVNGIKYSNLIYPMALAVLNVILKSDAKAVHTSFRELFNEKIDVSSRVAKFSEDTLAIYRKSGGLKQHHQDERTIATYLTFHNPENYTFYKYSFYKKLCGLLKENEAGKNEKYEHYLSLVNRIITDYIEADAELIDLVKSFIPEYYNGTNNILLAQDILFQMLDKKETVNYWIYAPGQNASKWEEFYQLGIMGLGWDSLGDLNNYPTKNDIKKRLQALEEVESSKQNDTAANYEFQKVIKEGDVIIVKKGISELLGYGVVISDYYYDAERNGYQKCRTVDWKVKGNWKVSYNLPLKTLTDITKYDSGTGSYAKYYEELMAIMKEVPATATTNVKEEFIEWISANVSGGNYFKNQFASETKRLRAELDNYEEVYEGEFENKLFTINPKDYKKDIDQIKSNIYNSATAFADYSKKHFSGRPRAILGKENYLRFLSEKFENKNSNRDMDNFISLNRILYGPPGTGKTYNTVLEAAKIVSGNMDLSYNRALEIFNDSLGNQIEFITFHQSYSYEDFIQGLRPDVNQNSHLSFERKDGIFMQIATNALFEYYKVLHQARNGQKKVAADATEVYLDFVRSLEIGQKFQTKSGQEIYVSNFTRNSNIEFKHLDRSRSYLVSGERLLKLFNSFPKINLIDRVHDDIRDAIGGCNTTVYYVALREFIKFHDQYLRTARDETSEVEDAYEGISYETKRELLSKASMTDLRTVSAHQVSPYVIIIDEINRANISRVFGELITLIEEDKRSHGTMPMKVTLPSGDTFIVPSNLYIIGTMNTADKSIALLDIALRRRFEFVPMYPQYLIEGMIIHYPEVLKAINDQICKRKTRDFQIGHSYFMESDDLEHIMNRKVIPLLLEYFMNDEKTVREIINNLPGCSIDTEQWPMKFSQN